LTLILLPGVVESIFWNMSTAEKDLRTRAEEAFVPEWQKELLNARRKAVEEGREDILEWDRVEAAATAAQGRPYWND